MILNTVLADDMDVRDVAMSSDAHLLPSSNAAATVTALLGPMPSVSQSFSMDMDATVLSLPSPLVMRSLATSITFLSAVPVRSMMARSSALLRDSAPLLIIFSLGLSSMQSSLIFMFFLQNYDNDSFVQKKCGGMPADFSFSLKFCLFFIRTLTDSHPIEYKKRKSKDFLF